MNSIYYHALVLLALPFVLIHTINIYFFTVTWTTSCLPFFFIVYIICVCMYTSCQTTASIRIFGLRNALRDNDWKWVVGGGVTHAGTARPLSLDSAPDCRSPSAHFLRWSSWCGLDLVRGGGTDSHSELATPPPSLFCSSMTLFMQTQHLKMKLRQ